MPRALRSFSAADWRSRFDDQVDSLSQFINCAEEKGRVYRFTPEIWSLEREDPWLK